MMQVGRAQGMVALNDALMELVTKKLVEPEEAYLKSVDKAAFEGLLKRANIDTKFVVSGRAVDRPASRQDERPSRRGRSAHPAARGVEPHSRRHQRTDFPSRWRHAAVDRLVLAGADAIRLVPDADVAARLAHPLVERHPSRPMIAVRVTRVGFERLERSPGTGRSVKPADCEPRKPDRAGVRVPSTYAAWRERPAATCEASRAC